ncbi:MAG TPA: aminomethyl-transferring glycine dehydrogenase subunit GcvPB [Candidatus Pullichristensenella stercorigallinarum]|uniref:glycine dehydrogenase (aminomethyl-transferring) n=1 Tax=Candidatus Pullichristensenella stercorigallinarum TaxID=2840909 RepID=A0A9D0ZLS3_9FIRM|nr:aminomethyl-transferring glycine dehydrogenase subunit GcvPB [Candidatus Pullichristensenella stercorigallinarum]
MKLLFEKSVPGRGMDILPPLDVPPCPLEEGLGRETAARLPQIAEGDLCRHYRALEKRAHGVCDGFYPLGSCTMKYNPKIDEQMAALEGFAGVHPLQGAESAQGCLEVYARAESCLKEITGMDAVSFQPAAGAHGEFLGLLLIKAYHHDRGDLARTKILVPDAAHGTNPASATMAGFEVVSVPSTANGRVDVEALRALAGADTAGLMLTNPNTLGIFDENILEITQIVHEAGGLCYYDGANLNAVMGVARPGDMGFDVVHLNLHKTFATPHGGGGPGSGAVGVKALLRDFLPDGQVAGKMGSYRFERPAKSVGRVKEFYGNFGVVVKALCYMLSLGAEGIPEAAAGAVLNANYLMRALEKGGYETAVPGLCMHEFVLTLEKLKHETGVSALDVAKAMIDRGIHPPTMYFPLIVHEALMLEPTETESRETLNECAEAMVEILKAAYAAPESLHACPVTTPIGRPDEVAAARNPVLKYGF